MELAWQFQKFILEPVSFYFCYPFSKHMTSVLKVNSQSKMLLEFWTSPPHSRQQECRRLLLPRGPCDTSFGILLARIQSHVLTQQQKRLGNVICFVKQQWVQLQLGLCQEGRRRKCVFGRHLVISLQRLSQTELRDCAAVDCDILALCRGPSLYPRGGVSYFASG